MKFIYSILFALLWIGVTITFGSYLYRMGLPIVNASAQKLLLRTIDEDLECRFRKLKPNQAYVTGKKHTKNKKPLQIRAGLTMYVNLPLILFIRIHLLCIELNNLTL